MTIESCFLSLDEDKPLGIWWADHKGCGVIPLGEFLKESKIGLSKKQAKRYANRLRDFIDDLDRYSDSPDC